MNQVLRQEKKFLLALDQYYKYSHFLSQVLHEDPHNNGVGYIVRSLYFDTIENDDFMDKEAGVEIRRKIRLRNYGADTPFAMLEMKQKEGMMQKKRSLKMTKEDAAEMTKGNYGVLLNYDNPFAAECFALMNARCYIPKAVIEYNRRAYIAKENSIRVTFDHHIVGTETNFDIFSKDLLQNSILNPYLLVMEVKFNGFLLSYIKDLMKNMTGSETAVSKYCLGRAVSMHYNF